VTSSWFPVKRGVRQYGVLSTFLCKLFIDELLNQLEKSNCGIINCGSPAFGNDIALLARSPTSPQTFISICFTYSQNWKCEFSSAKTDIRIFRPGRIVNTYPFMWKLEFKQIAKSRVHLGIPIMSDIKAVIKACDKDLF